MPRNIDIATEPPVSQRRLSSGITAMNHSPNAGIASIGSISRAITDTSRWRSARGSSSVPTTRMAASAASVAATARR